MTKTDQVSLARIDELRSIGKRIAQMLRADKGCYQAHAAVVCGISEKTYYRWLQGEGEHHVAFQTEVLPALYEQARALEKEAEDAVGSTELGSGAWASWYKWKMSSRYRKIFGDLAEADLGVPPRRVELTGKDGDAIKTEALVQYVVMVPPEED